MRPLLLKSPLSDHYYIVTKYREQPNKTNGEVGGKTVIVADRKFDVTTEFLALATEVARNRLQKERATLRRLTAAYRQLWLGRSANAAPAELADRQECERELRRILEDRSGRRRTHDGGGTAQGGTGA